MLRGGIIFLPLHSASEEDGTPEELITNGEKKVSFFLSEWKIFSTFALRFGGRGLGLKEGEKRGM